MGILGTDYTLRPGHAIFFLLVSSSVILGFSYLNEMYQRIQLQENLERQIQHISAERSVIQHKESLLQTQIENRNKEMKRMQNIYTFQTEEQRSNWEKERADLLENISSRDETIAEVQSEYESLKQQFENLRSVMDQFEKNQSRLLEKFSTQSTQCMHVIHMLSELCSKEKVNLVQKIAQVKKLNETSVNGKGTQSNTSTVPQDLYKSNKINSTVRETSNPPTNATARDLDHGKQSPLKTMQTVQELVSVLNSTTSTKDNEDEMIEFEKIENSTEENNVFNAQSEIGETEKIENLTEENNVFKSQTEIGETEKKENSTENNVFKSQTEIGKTDDKTSAEKELPKNRPLKEVKSQTQATKMTEENESLSDRNEVSESETPSQTVSKKGNDPQYPNISKNESLQLTSQDNRTADIVVLTDKQKENITLAVDSTKREGKAYRTEKNLEDRRKPQRLTLKKEKTPDGKIYKATGESEYKNKPEDMENGLELNDQEYLETIS